MKATNRLFYLEGRMEAEFSRCSHCTCRVKSVIIHILYTMNTADAPNETEAQVIQLCTELGFTCSLNEARESLQPHRGKGSVNHAVRWLMAEDGFHVIQRLQVSGYNYEDFIWYEANADKGLMNNNEINNTIFSMAESEYSNGSWNCLLCSFINKLDAALTSCEMCGNPGPLLSHRLALEENISAEVLKRGNERKQEEIKRSNMLKIDKIAQPKYWATFPQNIDHIEIELVDTKNKLFVDECNKICNFFHEGGVSSTKIISLKRIQSSNLWQRYAAQRNVIAQKSCNQGNPNERYVFHGTRNCKNTESILKNGFLGQHGQSKPYGTWTHDSSAYSGGSFAEVMQDGSRRIFICRAAIGTAGIDDGSGRRPKILPTGELADCHSGGGGVHVFYVDSQLYAEYLIQWI